MSAMSPNTCKLCVRAEQKRNNPACKGDWIASSLMLLAMTATHSRAFRLDVRRLDDRRPLLHLGLVERAEPFRRHLLLGRQFLPGLGEPLLHGRIGERAANRGVKFGDHLLRRALR